MLELKRTEFNWLVTSEHKKIMLADFKLTAPAWPDWVRRFKISVQDHDDADDGGKSIAEVRVHYEYRMIEMSLFKRYFSETNEGRIKCLLHEAGHAVHSPIAELFYYYNTDDEDGPFDFKELWNHAEEKACEDYSNCAYEMLFPKGVKE